MDPCCASIGIDPGDPIHAILLVSTGLTTSFGHCTGMCGPLHAVIASQAKSTAVSAATFHLGRIGAYATIGAAFGLAGPAIRSAGASSEIQAAISIGSGLVMLALVAAAGFGLGAPHRIFSRITGEAVARIHAMLTSPSKRRHFALGYANGFLPCGPVAIVALAAASARSPGEGALALALFGLGTVPVLAVLGASARWIGVAARRRLAHLGMASVAILSIQLVARGLAAIGRLPHFEVGGVVLW